MHPITVTLRLPNFICTLHSVLFYCVLQTFETDVEAAISFYLRFEAETDGVAADADKKNLEDEVDTEKTSEGTGCL